MAIADASNRRAIDRFRLHPMYTRVVVIPRAAGSEESTSMEGHAYDISLGGVRYELDSPLPAGTCVEVQIELPGARDPIRGSGQVVRVYDEADDPGPRRQAMRLDRFFSEIDRQRLARLIDDGWYGRPL
ncbi:MAG: PilZ domain-containing protein [Phycisphaerae bacterium]|nr:PilZ domain-containing protein [Phycisphaerae bacterium]